VEHQKRAGLTLLALAEQDEECLRVMAGVFEGMRTGFMGHIYWEDLQTGKQWGDTDSRMEGVDGVDQCVVM
jgi:hypothetical protein